MRYLGGKSKIRKQVAAFLESVRQPEQVYFEPFVGGGWVLQEMTGKRVASDGNKALIAMYQALQQGWQPPEFISEDEWRKWRKQQEVVADPMMAFCRFGCGFGGDWNGGYARSSSSRNYCLNARNSLLKQLPLIADVKFESRLFHEWMPKGALVYCDPPYAGTTAYGAFDGFDHDLFWRTMSEWCEHNTVVVSEYVAPDDWVCVREFHTKTDLHVSKPDVGATKSKRTERIFMHNSQAQKGL